MKEPLLYHQLLVNTQNELFEKLSTELEAKGIVQQPFLTALIERESEFPTGLPLKIGVAIPHTDGTYVNEDRLVFATLKQPILFNEMGGDEEDVLNVSVVIMLAIKEGKKHLSVLQKLIESIQKEGFIEELAQAKDTNKMKTIISTYL
ncbi:PTS system, galactitol-specific IIA component [Enterococcus sp. 7F3_DIV0205]|uniref:PTS system, galactitol-specific IIA component n=1 Tax=Candidatus Enterococcus palustris TaxID=1834189 RepID=A0AAQ3WCP7_9ENTE|nr:PTS sugar transporter subunit IIA [Enterococcus sp. 7F3_DIV0205]OTN83101.1 hypothetical protein A5821_003024 [Enterococcus sp. 7F3_DIV0205]